MLVFSPSQSLRARARRKSPDKSPTSSKHRKTAQLLSVEPACERGQKETVIGISFRAHRVLGRVNLQNATADRPQYTTHASSSQTKPVDSLPSVLSSAIKPQAKVASYWCHSRTSTPKKKKKYFSIVYKRNTFLSPFKTLN